MSLFAIGDIHGCATALDVLLNAIALQPGDRLITLGDYCNKGQETKAVFDRLIQLDRRGLLIPIRGNHELRFLQAMALQQIQIADQTLLDAATLWSYGQGNQFGELADIPDAHLRFVRDYCWDWYETEYHIFVHATVRPHKPMAQQPPEALFWNKLTDPQPHQSGKTVICGHTPQKTGRPLNLGHVICLDTAAADGQWLTCLQVDSGRIWQANQQGDLQTSWIYSHPKQLVKA
ncbi:metallophosphoesterase [Lyngbya confervoides]|uniref:Metallophosphoesterase n=1 Tax=Lyngbya confervoides BDU141951 TaxID=1574623 RepID=A0ABD4T681_9CYAN|nr:metallophosphoesterase [Lyngbya confervoides]MCM1983985.1 metallophosphoesterase [Lyngbya confervoides BDU141951]